jgi:orotate phosphoribosyltransferase-like protein
MNQIDQVKELQRQGLGASGIADRLGIDRKTCTKYMAAEDFSTTAPERALSVSKLARGRLRSTNGLMKPPDAVQAAPYGPESPPTTH